MSIRVSYAFAVLILLVAVILRFAGFATLPQGFSDNEINDVRIAETVRQGRVEVFYNLNGEGREGVYQIALTGATAIIGGGTFGFRVVSLFAGIVGLALVYALGSRLCGPLAGAAGMALLAVNFSAILLSRVVAREAILMAWSAAVMLTLARSFFVYGESRARLPDSAAFAALGLLLGLGFYLHPISLVVTLFAMTFIVYRVLTERPFPRRAISFTWFMLVVVIVLAMPYVLSSIQLPRLAGTARLGMDFPRSLSDIIASLAAGFNGFLFYGDASAANNLPGRPLFDLISGLLMAVGFLVTLRTARQPGSTLIILALIFLTPVVLLAPNTPNFQLFSALLPVMALLFGMGVSTIYYSLRGIARAVSAVALVALFGFNLVWVGGDLFNKWAALPAVQTTYNQRLGTLARFVDQHVDTPTLLCADQLRTDSPYTLTNAEKLAVMMHRADAPLRASDCGTTLVLTNGGDWQYVVMLDPKGLQAMNPALQRWLAPGEEISLPSIDQPSVVHLRAADALANQVGEFTTTSPVTFPPDAPGGFGVMLPPVRLQGNLAFLGYEKSWSSSYHPGDVLTVITYWRIDGEVPPDLRFFTHVQNDPAARPAAQSDFIAVLPELLAPRDVLIQVSYIDLPFSLPVGRYSISVGAYEAGTGTRLSAFDGDLQRSPRLFLGDFAIQRQ